MANRIITKSQSNLITDALEIERETALNSDALGYMARALTLATLPHKNPNAESFTRTNGNFTVRITDAVGQGLPYGSYPRLVLAWLTTEAVIKQSRTLDLGDSLAHFMRELGLGTDGHTTRLLKNQTAKLFGSSIACTYSDGSRASAHIVNIASDFDIWWHPKQLEQLSIHNSSVTLSTDFFNDIVTNPIPIDLRALHALKRSPMALDIYIWLTYRMSFLHKKTAITWEQLQMQLGAGYEFTPQGRKNFQRAFTKHLKSVLTVYPDARVETIPGRLILSPSPPHIPKNK